MPEDTIRKTMRVGMGGVEVVLRGKTAGTRFSERLMSWISNTLRYVSSQTGLSADEQRETEIAVAEHLERRGHA